jgi:inactive STAND
VKNECNAVPDLDLTPKYCLEDIGEVAIRALLHLLGLPLDNASLIEEEIFFRSSQPRNTSREVIAKVTKHNNSVALRPLRNFVAGLLEAVADGYLYKSDAKGRYLTSEEKYAASCTIDATERRNQVTSIITSPELINYYNLYVNNKNNKNSVLEGRIKRWKLPIGLYKRGVNLDKLHENIRQSLHYLDYQNQTEEFEENFKTHEIFFVDAPEHAPQKWLASRLVKVINDRRKNKVRVYYIYENGLDYDYAGFLEALFGDSKESTNSSIIQKLASGSSELAVLIVRGFRNRKTIQKEFFKDLEVVLSMDNPKYKLRILWVDESPPYFINQQWEDWEVSIRKKLFPLPRLDEINEVHIRNWYTDQKLDGTRFAKLVEDEIEWQEPAKILEKICNRLGMKGKIEEIERELWRFK